MGYQLILSNLKFVDAQFLVIVYNDTSCHVTLGDFQRWTQGKDIIWRNNARYLVRKQRLLNVSDCAE